MTLDRDQTQQLAHLTRLALDESQIARLSADLERMVAMVEQVQEVDTSTLTGVIHVHADSQPLRADTALAPQQRYADAAAAHKDGFVVVPKTLV